MKFLYGLSAALLGSTLLAGAAAAADNTRHSHPHFQAGEQPAHSASQTPSAQPRGSHAPLNATPGGWASAHGYRGGNNNASAPPRPLNNNPQSFAAQNNGSSNQGWNWQHGHNGGHTASPPRNNAAPNNNANAGWAAAHGYNSGHSGSHPHWNANTLRDHNVSHWSASNRAAWQHGRWSHGRRNGRDGWWWYSGGTYFFYDQPVYPYPGYVSNYYYDDGSYYGDSDGYDGYDDPGYGAEPGDSQYYWYYCDNPAGYYPYVKSCHGPWRAVTPTPPSQQGYDDQAGPDDGDQGPPPGYDDRNQPPRDQYDGPDDDDRGPPLGYDNGPYDDEDGPPQR